MHGVRRVVGALGEVLLSLGLLVLLFVAWQLWWTDVSANHAQAATLHQLERDFDSGSATVGGTQGNGGEDLVTLSKVPFGKAFAVLRVPRFGSDFARPIVQGISTSDLQAGIGHYPRTVMPGKIGNFSVAGHRTTYGRPFHDIDTLQTGDPIIVETKTTYYLYRVRSHLIVSPGDSDVVAPVPNHPGKRPIARWMTMTSCHPKYNATQRYIVFAKLATTYPRGRGLPPNALLQAKGS